MQTPKAKLKARRGAIGRGRENKRRAKRGRKPIIQPLEIASAKERREALDKGRMVFYDGERKIELPLLLSDSALKNSTLQGVYKLGVGRYVVFRSGLNDTFGPIIAFRELNLESSRESSILRNFFFRTPDLGHIEIQNPDDLHRRLGLRGASMAERHVRARMGGEHEFSTTKTFKGLYEKLGYKVIAMSRPDPSHTFYLMRKKGKHQPKDNLDEYHRIEAIDPRRGKARTFTFPIKKEV